MGSINWLYFDDLRTSVTRYHSFHDMLNSHPSSCFFLAVCEKSPFPANKILNTDIQTSERKDSPPRHSILSQQDTVEPRFNEVRRDWGNWFVILKVRYIEVLFLTLHYYWAEKCRSLYRGLRYIEVH